VSIRDSNRYCSIVSGRPLSAHVDKFNPSQGIVNLTYSNINEDSNILNKENLPKEIIDLPEESFNKLDRENVLISSEIALDNETNENILNNTTYSSQIQVESQINLPNEEIKQNAIISQNLQQNSQFAQSTHNFQCPEHYK
jgi:hypothetical protein